jgi:uncharacterized protein
MGAFHRRGTTMIRWPLGIVRKRFSCAPRTVAAAIVFVLCSIGIAKNALGQQPSFNCATNKAPDEITICTNPSLSGLDRQLSDLYIAALKNLSDDQKTQARERQRNWLMQRSACKQDVACISALYQARISELRSKDFGTQASFNCATSKAQDEITICANPPLSGLDRQLSELYIAALKNLSDDQKTQARERQRNWLMQRSACKQDVACISVAATQPNTGRWQPAKCLRQAKVTQ